MFFQPRLQVSLRLFSDENEPDMNAQTGLSASGMSKFWFKSARTNSKSLLRHSDPGFQILYFTFGKSKVNFRTLLLRKVK